MNYKRDYSYPIVYTYFSHPGVSRDQIYSHFANSIVMEHPENKRREETHDVATCCRRDPPPSWWRPPPSSPTVPKRLSRNQSYLQRTKSKRDQSVRDQSVREKGSDDSLLAADGGGGAGCAM